jgi:hypothetical protein
LLASLGKSRRAYHKRKVKTMGADFILSSIPACNLDEARVKRLNEIIDGLEQADLEDAAYTALDCEIKDATDEDWGKCRDRLRQAVSELVDADGRREVASICYEGMAYPMLFSGGMSWGDDPTEIGREFDLINGCDPLYMQLHEWAIDDHKPKGKRTMTVVAWLDNCGADADQVEAETADEAIAAYKRLVAEDSMKHRFEHLTGEAHEAEFQRQLERIDETVQVCGVFAGKIENLI